MANIKSPFMVFEEFISPKQCEWLTYKLDFFHPDTDEDGRPIKSLHAKEVCQQMVFDRWDRISENIAEYYGITYKGTETIIFEWYPTGTISEPICENGMYVKNKWHRALQRDVSAILFLSDYSTDEYFDSKYEVYGGKLEFPSHGFGFNPQRGTLITYPSDPHFVNVTSPILAGELIQARFQMAATEPYLYNPEDFPGDFSVWFPDDL